MSHLSDFQDEWIEEVRIIDKYMNGPGSLTANEWVLFHRLFDHGDQLREILAEVKRDHPQEFEKIRNGA
ncbi:MAG: hypothetical protein ABSG07_18690 [Terriglobales bacterium]|jgi:hypothetical protein